MDLELSRAEQEIQTEEAALHAELSRWAKVSGDLQARMSTLRAAAIEVDEMEVVQRAQEGAPEVDAARSFAGARAAREAALKARRQTTAAVKEQLATLKPLLQKLVAQVVADEKAVAAAQDRAKAKTQIAMPAVTPPVAPRLKAPEVRAAPTPQLKAEPQPQRGRPRVKMQAEVDFHSDNNFFNGFSTNISDGGLFIATVNLLPLGTQVDLSFSLPDGEPIEAKGVVRWVREINDALPEVFPGMGVQFTALNQGADVAIGHFLAQRAPLFFASADA